MVNKELEKIRTYIWYLTSHSAVFGKICMIPRAVSLVFLSYHRVERGCLSLASSATAHIMSCRHGEWMQNRTEQLAS
jgi:hypothetical protein